MGMFDTITYTCNKCKSRESFQTKAADTPSQRTFNLDLGYLPHDIAENMSKENEIICEACGHSFSLSLEPLGLQVWRKPLPDLDWRKTIGHDDDNL